MSVPSSLAAPRPTSVTVAVVVGWIAVVLDVIGAVSLYLFAGSDTLLEATGLDTATVRGAAIGSLVLAAILALVVRGLGRGGNVSRALVTFVMLLRIGFGIWALIALSTHHVTESLLTIAFGLAVIAMLWNRRASEFFATP